TACNEWGLTEQLFRDVVVITQRKTRRGSATIQGTRFRVKSIAPSKYFGTTYVWRGENRVEISDPARTLVDILDDPAIGGGARHVAEVTEAYFASEYRDDEKLLDYTRRAGNRTVFKRLGYLVEILGLATPEISKQCRAGLSSGISLLDPSMPSSGPIAKLWNLRLNAMIRQTSKT
ncbi:MAG: type IV toxin-antitoxin system AbiEi family antitoxin domain-containing protein, partial [Chthoniobacterales bacterium]